MEPTERLDEEAVARLFDSCRDLIDPAGAEQVEHYLEHGEPELAFEGMVLELMAKDVRPPGFGFSEWKALAVRMGLNEDPVFDGNFWPKFLAWGGSRE